MTHPGLAADRRPPDRLQQFSAGSNKQRNGGLDVIDTDGQPGGLERTPPLTVAGDDEDGQPRRGDRRQFQACFRIGETQADFAMQQSTVEVDGSLQRSSVDETRV
jgi:hypothetical protein